MGRPAPEGIDPDRIALGVQQPWAELILRGIKTLEVRSQHTTLLGPIYLYASKRLSSLPAAQTAASRHGIGHETLPMGLLVGSVQIVGSRPARRGDSQAACVPAQLLEQKFVWELGEPQRFDKPLPVRFLPYGIWFYPFKRRPAGRRGKS
jgi:ASCH domain